ncbi:MAG: ribosome-binding factor A [bacterium]
MKPFRNLKASTLIQDELGKVFTRDMDFEGALVTIMDVEVDEKLLHATVKIGILPYEKGPGVYLYLTRHASDLRHKLLKKMNIKPMPFLKFIIEEPVVAKDVSVEVEKDNQVI